jgi:uncharacterized membrane protein YdjX (TVP38/TMEM64 family)
MKKHWGVLAVLILIAVVAFAIGGAPLIRFLADQERVRAWIEGLGVWGPLALIAMIIVQTVLSVSPVSLLAIVGAMYLASGRACCMPLSGWRLARRCA